MEWLAYGIPTLLLAAALAYAVMRSGRLRRSERRTLDDRTRNVQRSEDPQKPEQPTRT